MTEGTRSKTGGVGDSDSNAGKGDILDPGADNKDSRRKKSDHSTPRAESDIMDSGNRETSFRR